MKVAIHIRENSFSYRWIQYCQNRGIDFIEVNIYDSDIISNLLANKVNYLLAHLSLDDYKTKLIAHSILHSIEKAGIIVFPSHNIFWHYDDKLTQKYIFEAYNIPYAQMHVLYNKDDATKWLNEATFPLVFKLRGGAGSSNVYLLKNRNQAMKFAKKIFGKGFKSIRPITNDFKTKLNKHKGLVDYIDVLLRLPKTIHRIIIQNNYNKRQNGYFLIQDFLAGNAFDIRVTIIGNRAFAFRRFVRKNDFKASGSGSIDYDIEKIDRRAIKMAFETAGKIGNQSIAFDIIMDASNEPKIIEMSYVYVAEAVHNCSGYWDSSLVFHNQPCWPETAIIEDLLSGDQTWNKK